jgi:hypothetical protein
MHMSWCKRFRTFTLPPATPWPSKFLPRLHFLNAVSLLSCAALNFWRILQMACCMQKYTIFFLLLRGRIPQPEEQCSIREANVEIKMDWNWNHANGLLYAIICDFFTFEKITVNRNTSVQSGMQTYRAKWIQILCLGASAPIEMIW